MAKAVDIAAKELIAIASPGQGFIFISLLFLLYISEDPNFCQTKLALLAMTVSQVQLDRAKKSTKSAVLMNLESRVRSHFLYLIFFLNCDVSNIVESACGSLSFRLPCLLLPKASTLCLLRRGLGPSEFSNSVSLTQSPFPSSLFKNGSCQTQQYFHVWLCACLIPHLN